MVTKRKYRAQPLQVVCTEEMRAVIDEIAQGEEISVAQVVREALEGKGLDARHHTYVERVGQKNVATLPGIPV